MKLSMLRSIGLSLMVAAGLGSIAQTARADDDDSRAEDEPERSASDHSWHPGEFGAKFLDFRSYDGDVAVELAVRIKQR